MDCSWIVQELAEVCWAATLIPKDCCGIAIGLPRVALGFAPPWDWRGIGIAKGLHGNCGIGNGLFWDCARVGLGLPRECRAKALGIALGLPWGCSRVAQRLLGDCPRIA